MSHLPLLPAILAALWIFAAFIQEFLRNPKPVEVHYYTAIEAIKLMKDWGVWMTTIATAAVAANGILFHLNTRGTCSVNCSSYASISIFAFVGSILLDAWLIGCLPSVIAGLKYEQVHIDNDIYERPLFSFLPPRVFRVGFVGNIQNALFVIAVYTFALYVASI